VLQQLVTEELLRFLSEAFPAVPSRSMTSRELDHLIGQQEVITYLQRLMEEQQDASLNMENL
jgi:hypothetical protein